MKDPVDVAETAIAFLESLEGKERKQGAEAARILRNATCKLKVDRGAALNELQYGLSYKGLLEWHWSDNTFEALKSLCTEFYNCWEAKRSDI